MLFLSILFSFFPFIQCYKPKFCINCKYLIPDNVLGSQSLYSRCLKFPKKSQNNVDYLVSGERKKDFTIYYYCTIARDQEDMCGKEGKGYRRKPSLKDRSEDEENIKWDLP